MSANERSEASRTEALVRELHRVRLQLLHRIARLTARPATAHLAHRLRVHERAIERELALEAALSVDEVRTEAMIDAAAERSDVVDMGRLAEKSGVLRAERTRIEARLYAERVASREAQQLLERRARAATVALLR
jgi:hypothetical protein